MIRRLRPVASALAAALDWPGRSAWLVWTPFAAYVALVAIATSRHEPWFDEAQAWLLARDLPYPQLMFGQLRYEGTPGLWHSILFFANRAGVPYAGLNVIGAAAAGAAAFLLLRFSPFPAVVRLMLPFGYFLAYQYAVVARSYNLLAPLLFAAAVLFPRRHARPILYISILILLCHVSLHGALIALGLVLLEIPFLAGRGRKSARVWLAVGLFVANGVLLAIQLFPPRDLVVATQLGPHGIRPAPARHLDLDRLWTLGLQVLHGAVVESPLFSELILIACAIWLLERGRLAAGLLPIGLLLLLAAFGYHSVWHDGTIWLVWIFALWLSYQPSEGAPAVRPPWPGHWRQIAAASLAVACAVQIVWTTRAFLYDFAEPYSGSPALAARLQQLGCQGCRIHADGFKALAVEPYFTRNVFSNINGGRPDQSFWRWSSENPLIRNGRDSVWWNDPDYVVCGTDEYLKRPADYRILGSFPGELFWKRKTFEPDSYVLLSRELRRQPSPRPVR